MNKWKCTVCGYIHEGEEPPDQCPVCGADKSKFVLLENEEKKVPSEPTDSSGSQPGAESITETSANRNEPVKTSYEQISQLMTRFHAHPISVHIPNGVLPLSVLFAVIAIVFRSNSFGIAAHFNMVFVCLTMPAVLYFGYVDWQNRFGGNMTKIFLGKIICGAVLSGASLGLALWWSFDADIIQSNSYRRWAFLFFHILTLCPAVIAGYLGGKLVFNKYE